MSSLLTVQRATVRSAQVPRRLTSTQQAPQHHAKYLSSRWIDEWWLSGCTSTTYWAVFEPDMARTYGEIVRASFENVFAQTLNREAAVFVDIGSGKGRITAAAAQEGCYTKAFGIEKYKDKYDESMQLRASLPEEVQLRLDYTLSDIADLDLRDLIQAWSQPEVLLFCNNLAFGHGMNGRLGRSIRETMDSLPDIRVAVVATTPLEALTDRQDSLIFLDMTWGPKHESSVYVWHSSKSDKVQGSAQESSHHQGRIFASGI